MLDSHDYDYLYDKYNDNEIDYDEYGDLYEKGDIETYKEMREAKEYWEGEYDYQRSLEDS